MTATSADSALVRRLAIVSIASAIAVLILYLVAVRTTAGQEFDDIAFSGRDVEDPEITRATNEVLHSVTRLTLFVATAGLVLLALLRRRLRLALAVGGAVAGSVVTTEVLKLHILTRPVLDDVDGITINSYPSGHATIAMALGLGLVMVTPHHRRWMAAGVAVAFASLFGVGVLATGWHRPSDSIGAALVCTAVFCAVTAMLIAWRGSGEVTVEGVERWLHGRSLAVVAAVVTLVTGYALFETLRADSLTTVEFAGAYLLVAVIILAFAACVVAGYTGALRSVSLDPPSADDVTADAAPGERAGGDAARSR